MEVRMSRPEDFDACVKILPPRWQKPRMKARVGYLVMSRSALVAVEADSVIGFALMETDFFDDNSLYLRTVAVDSDRRRSGIGTRLVESVIGHARTLGVRRIFFDGLERQDEISRNGAEKLGFKPAGYVDNMHDEGGRYNIYSLPVYA